MVRPIRESAKRANYNFQHQQLIRFSSEIDDSSDNEEGSGTQQSSEEREGSTDQEPNEPLVYVSDASAEDDDKEEEEDDEEDQEDLELDDEDREMLQEGQPNSEAATRSPQPSVASPGKESDDSEPVSRGIGRAAKIPVADESSDGEDTGATSPNKINQPLKFGKESRQLDHMADRQLLKSAKMAAIASGNLGDVASGYQTLPAFDRTLDVLIPAEIEASDRLTRFRLIKNALDKVDAQTWETLPSRPKSLLPDDVRTLLSLPKLRDVSFYPSRDGVTIAPPQYTLSEDILKNKLSVFTRPGSRSRNAAPGTGPLTVTPEVWHKVVPVFIELLERHPCDGTTGGELSAFRQSLFRVALCHKYPDHTRLAHRLNYGERNNRRGYWVKDITVRFRDSSVEPVWNMDIHVVPDYVDTTKTSPVLPPIRYTTTTPSGNKNKKGIETVIKSYTDIRPMNPPPGLSVHQKAQHEAAITFLYWLDCTISVKVFESRSAFGGWLQSMTQQYIGRRSSKLRRTGMFDGKPLYYLQSVTKGKSFQTHIHLAEAAHRAVFDQSYKDTTRQKVLRERVIVVKSTAWVAVSRVLDIIDQTYLGHGLKSSWLNGAAAADAINAELRAGEFVPVRCNHSADQRAFVHHTCGECGNAVLCDDIHHGQDLDVLTCNDCYKRLNVVHSYSKSGRNSWELTRLADIIARERKIPRAEAYKVATPAAQSIPGRAGFDEDPVKVNDYYIPGRKRTLDGHPSQRISLDAKFQAVQHGPQQADGTVEAALHVKNNIVVTSRWLNFLKHIQAPGSIQIIKEMTVIHDKIGDMSDKKMQESLKASLAELRALEQGLFEASLKIPFSKKDRFLQKLTVEEHTIREYELRSGKLIEDLKGWPKRAKTKYHNYFECAPRSDWVPGLPGDFERRLRPLIKEILANKLSHIDVDSGDDGCPFPGDPTGKPADWSYWTAWGFFGDRLLRMWLLCNGRWSLVDTTETLFLTCLVQWVRGERGVAGLDWVLYRRHPRRLAVAHAVHGRQMVGLFPEFAHTMEDMREDVNIRMETCSENYAVLNYDEPAVAQIAKEIREIQVPSADWNPNLPTPHDIDVSQSHGDDDDTNKIMDEEFDAMDDIDIGGGQIEFIVGEDEAELPDADFSDNENDDDEDSDTNMKRSEDDTFKKSSEKVDKGKKPATKDDDEDVKEYGKQGSSKDTKGKKPQPRMPETRDSDGEDLDIDEPPKKKRTRRASFDLSGIQSMSEIPKSDDLSYRLSLLHQAIAMYFLDWIEDPKITNAFKEMKTGLDKDDVERFHKYDDELIRLTTGIERDQGPGPAPPALPPIQSSPIAPPTDVAPITTSIASSIAALASAFTRPTLAHFLPNYVHDRMPADRFEQINSGLANHLPQKKEELGVKVILTRMDHALEGDDAGWFGRLEDELIILLSR